MFVAVHNTEVSQEYPLTVNNATVLVCVGKSSQMGFHMFVLHVIDLQ